MFALPSMWNLAISTIVFFVAAWYVRRYLDEQELPKGMTRSVLVFSLAFMASWGAGEAVDWVQEKIEGPQAAASAASAPDELTQLLEQVGQRKQ